METRSLAELLGIILKECETKGFNNRGICHRINEAYAVDLISGYEMCSLINYIKTFSAHFKQKNENSSIPDGFFFEIDYYGNEKRLDFLRKQIQKEHENTQHSTELG